MGGCATKPRALESLPAEDPSNPKQASKAAEGDSTVVGDNVDAGQSPTVEIEPKEEPLLDLSDPTLDAPNSNGVMIDDSAPAVIELASEIGGNLDDSEKAPEVSPIEKKPENDAQNAESPKTEAAPEVSPVEQKPEDLAQNSESLKTVKAAAPEVSHVEEKPENLANNSEITM